MNHPVLDTHNFSWRYCEPKVPKGQSATRSRGNRSRVRPETWVFNRLQAMSQNPSLLTRKLVFEINELDELENFERPEGSLGRECTPVGLGRRHRQPRDSSSATLLQTAAVWKTPFSSSGNAWHSVAFFQHKDLQLDFD